jgi:alcohol dehydrogenase
METSGYVVPEVLSGPQKYDELKKRIQTGRTLIIASQSVSKLEIYKKLIQNLKHVPLQVFNDVKANPSPTQIDHAFYNLEKFQPRNIVAIGGGSVIDFSKVLRARFSNKRINATMGLLGLERFENENINLIAIPTTAGTGSEVTQFATIWSEIDSGKESIESFSLVPNAILLDPLLIQSASLDQILFSGLDALSHCIETIWNRHRTKSSLEFASKGLRCILDSLPIVLEGVATESHFETLQQGALFGGKAISINHTAIAHSISYPITAYLRVPHGLACSFTIPAIYRGLFQQSTQAKQEKTILEEAITFLETLELPKKVSQYGNVEEVISVGTRWSTKERLGNFSINTSNENIRDILIHSLV